MHIHAQNIEEHDRKAVRAFSRSDQHVAITILITTIIMIFDHNYYRDFDYNFHPPRGDQGGCRFDREDLRFSGPGRRFEREKARFCGPGRRLDCENFRF